MSTLLAPSGSSKRWCKILFTLIPFMMLFSAPGGPALHIHEPVLVRAEFLSETLDHKNKNTPVSVHVETHDGKKVMAEIVDCGGPSPGELPAYGAGEYPPHSYHKIKLRVTGNPTVKSACEGFKTKVGIKAHPDDQWAFKGLTVLYFSDNTLLTNKSTALALHSTEGKYVDVEY